MSNKRWGKRFNTEMKARFGTEDYSEIGFIEDISVFGFFLKTAQTFPEDTCIKIQVLTQRKQLISLEGTVQWCRKKHPSVIWVSKEAGMGIKIKRFLNGQELYESLCQQLCRVETIKNSKSGIKEQPGVAKQGFLKKLFNH